MKLAELQSNFQAYLVADTPDVEASKPFLSAMVDDETVGIHKRLNIYHFAYRARMEEALGTVFVNLREWLGCQRFHDVVQSYLAENPSEYRNLRWYGDTLADYLAETMPNSPLATDLAAFEWALSLAFDAADDSTLTLEALSSYAPERWNDLTLNWHPSVQIRQANTSVIPAWQSLSAGEMPMIDDGPTTYLVWRQNMLSYFKTLEANEALAIELMMQGNTFGQLCEAMADVVGQDQAMTVTAGYLAEWINADMLLLSSLASMD